MTILHLHVWTNDGPSVTGRRPVRAVLEDPTSGRQEHIDSADDLRALLDTESGDGVTIVVADIAEPA